VVLINLEEEYQLSVFNGIQNRAIKEGVEVVCLMIENDPFVPGGLIQKFPESSIFNLDGIILLTSALSDNSHIHSKSDIRKIWGKLPVVSAGQNVMGVPSIYVQTDDSMKQLVEHLVLKHNYRKFLFIGGGKKQHDAILRERIFVQTMEAYKPWFPDLSYIIKNGLFTEDSSFKVMEKLNAEKNINLDAVVCANDNMAIGVYKFFKMKSKNSQIKECAVTGFDDIPQAQYEIPALTTVRQPLSEMGEQAMELILKVINKEKNILAYKNYIESTIVFRESCGCRKETQSKDFSEMESKLREMKNTYINVENYLRLTSQIGQKLNQTQDISEMNKVLRLNLGELGIRNFNILRFTKEFFVQPIFVLRDGEEKERFYNESELSINDFYNMFISCSEKKVPVLLIKQLYDGGVSAGCIIFEAEQDVLRYLNSISLAISQCLIRINVMEERRKRSEYLEQEVEKRTSELVEANEKRLKLEADVLRISELERQRFSNDLHDDICQRLAGISMLCRSYSSGKTPQKQELSELANLISETLQCTRQYAHNSYPVELESLGLKRSLSNLCSSFEVQSGLSFSYEWDIKNDVEEQLNKVQKLNVFRIVQEALHNCVKHSEATKVIVRSRMENKCLCFSVIDNGKGFNSQDEELREGIGMNSMQYRANQIGAAFSIKNNDDKGCCVEVKLPFTVK
nr:substrate-binding domain-containing protein [Treponema sp.]